MLTSYRYYTVSFKKIKHNQSLRRIIWRKEVMHLLVYPIGTTAGCGFAAKALARSGIPLTDHPSPEVTHLLLDIPSFEPNGQLRGGGRLEDQLERLPDSITVIGGNLRHSVLENYETIDLLKDEQYLAMNAAITADCAIRVAGEKLKTTFRDTQVLILGWGRIGKCLSQLLTGLHCPVTVAARKDTDRAQIRSLNIPAVDFFEAQKLAVTYDLIFNTVPAPVLTQLPAGTLGVELASVDGIMGENVITARGLPGKVAPVSSGRLIARTLLPYLRRKCI